MATWTGPRARWTFHLGLLGPTGAHWLDGPPDLTCKDSTRQHSVDDPLMSCKQLQSWPDMPGEAVDPGLSTSTFTASPAATSGALQPGNDTTVR